MEAINQNTRTPDNRNSEGRGQKTEQLPIALTLKANQVAAMLGVSVRQVWRLHTTGRLPRPVRLGNCIRWVRTELEAFIQAGAPNRERWEQMKQNAR